MLWTILVVLLVLWLLGFIGHIGGSLIHLLLVVAVIVLIYNLVTALSLRRAFRCPSNQSRLPRAAGEKTDAVPDRGVDNGRRDPHMCGRILFSLVSP
jgi:hypothetical protein